MVQPLLVNEDLVIIRSVLEIMQLLFIATSLEMAVQGDIVIIQARVLVIEANAIPTMQFVRSPKQLLVSTVIGLSTIVPTSLE